MGRRILLDQTVGFSGSAAGNWLATLSLLRTSLCTCLTGEVAIDWVTGRSGSTAQKGGIEPGSMYSQAYVSMDGVGGRSASVAPCDRVSLKRRAREAGRG